VIAGVPPSGSIHNGPVQRMLTKATIAPTQNQCGQPRTTAPPYNHARHLFLLSHHPNQTRVCL
jgi:hypothetical protein